MSRNPASFGRKAPRTEGRHRRYTAQEIAELTRMRDAIARGSSARVAAEEAKQGRSNPRGPVEKVVAAVHDMDERAPAGGPQREVDAKFQEIVARFD